MHLCAQQPILEISEYKEYISKILVKIELLCRYLIQYAIRAPRKDRVKAKIKRSAPALDMFEDLHNILFATDSLYAVEVQGNTSAGRFTKPARRGMALHISQDLLSKSKTETINAMNEINQLEKMR